jgi:sulfur-oxidizing protein SoxZ
VAEPIRIRAQVEDGIAHVKVLMPHPMETGLRSDATGALVPAHHITEVQISLGTRLVLAARMSIAVAQDPLLSFRFKGAQPGDRLRVVWTDNRGNRRGDEIAIS